MQTGDAALVEWIRGEIKNRGPQSFGWFMQQALYHPSDGYYSAGRCVIGRKGDYFTNVSVGPLFGRLLTAQFVEIWQRLGKPHDFRIVEQGAHDGQFACDVLRAAQKSAPEFFEAVRYRIVEPFPVLQERQKRLLKPFGARVEWRDSLEPFVGVHFSNEFLDALPVRLIRGGVEQLVGLEGEQFVFVEQPLSPDTARDQSAFNEVALKWVDSVALNLKRGYVIAIDYGCCEADFQRNAQARSRHRRLDSPLAQVGQADITVPVHWPSIVKQAEVGGLRITGFTDQHHFLAGILCAFCGDSPLESPKAKRQLQTLLHPEMLGRAFQALGLGKNVGLDEQPLAGFTFGREPSRSLG